MQLLVHGFHWQRCKGPWSTRRSPVRLKDWRTMTSSPAIRCTMLEPDIAVLTLDVPGKSANTLSSSVLQELSDHLDVLQSRDDLAGLIITSGKPDMFIAGADLREFVALNDHLNAPFGSEAYSPESTYGVVSNIDAASAPVGSTSCSRSQTACLHAGNSTCPGGTAACSVRSSAGRPPRDCCR